MDITITSVAKWCESHCPRTLCVCEAQQKLCNPKPIISLMDCQSFSSQQHICLILSTVVTAASLLWTEWRTSSPVYCPVQLPWQPAPSPLSGDERDCREHPALLCFPLICLQQLPPHFSSSSSVVPHFPLFFFKNLIRDFWSAWQWVLTKEWGGCHVNSLGCGYASDSAVCRRQKGTGLGRAESVFGLHARIGWRSKPSCSCSPSFLYLPN